MLGVNEIDERAIKIQEKIIQSMTKKERQNPEILNSSRKFRIARGSGTDIKDVNSLLKKFKTAKQMATSIGGMDKNQMKNIMKKFGDLNGDIFNN
jgi:signal recognition particle subunit SRP54